MSVMFKPKYTITSEIINNLAPLRTIEKVHRRFSNPTHPVSIAMKKMPDIQAIRIIERLDK